MKQLNYTNMTNAIRFLTADAVEKAKSGHPGMPMGMAEIATTLWSNHLSYNPTNPQWFNRDRFVLSNGHGSMLIYSLLHLTGYNLSINDLKQFRQLHSKTPGHPEYGYTDGVETTTGPLGQGIANAVGMAIAEKVLASQYNKDGLAIVDHYTYVFLGDGCLMEGISHEVCSLAGTLGLNKLIVMYDDNGISIDGEVEAWFNEDVSARFIAYHWNVIEVKDGHDIVAIDNAIRQAKNSDKPTLIKCKTIIGKGAPTKAGSESCHGSPLGAAEIALMREQLAWNYAPFEVPSSVYADFDNKANGAKLEQEWNQLFAKYTQTYPELAAQFTRVMSGQLPTNFAELEKSLVARDVANPVEIATRKSSQNSLNMISQYFPELFGGSADLTGSNLTNWDKKCEWINFKNYAGNYLSYGVREFGMAAITNGILLHGGLRPYGGTFLMFSEYARNALRMASLMKIANIFVFTHDSIGLGEDGPTHQPVEQTATLRLIPNMNVWRPADSIETDIAWLNALRQKNTPTCLILSRQNLPQISTNISVELIEKGGYVLEHPAKSSADVVIIASGSEVSIALAVSKMLQSRDIAVQVVSMPCSNLFDRQDIEYRHSALPRNARLTVSIEAGVTSGWYKYIGIDGLACGVDSFGESAPANDLYKHFELTAENICNKIVNKIK